MEAIFLGTGAGAPNRKRNVTSIALRFDQTSEVWLFDCGEGTQHQIQRSSISTPQISHIFITHLHGDHLFGLPGLLSSRSLQAGSQSPVVIIGPVGIREYLHTVMTLSQTNLSFPTQVIELENDGLVLSTTLAKVTSATLNHTVKSVGYAITEPNKPGKFMLEQAHALGIPEGPLYGQLKRGEHIQLADGRTFSGQDFMYPEVPGKKVTILGDTSPCASSIELAWEADLLIHEATFAASETELSAKSGHSTTTDAAQTAKDAKVCKLVLTHISARYNESKIPSLLTEARSIFEHTEIAEDFAKFQA